VAALQEGATPAGGTGGVGVGMGGTSPLALGILAPEMALLVDDGRSAGGIRAYRNSASTAEGGERSTTITEYGIPLSPPRTSQELLASLQPYVTGGSAVTSTETAIDVL
jgi:hypothetical protein